MAKDPGDYEVGYGRPPKDHQQKKGQPSINPYGRRGKPKNEPELGARSMPRDALDEFYGVLFEEGYWPLNKKRKPAKNLIVAFVRSMANAAVQARSAAAQQNFQNALVAGHMHKAAREQQWAEMVTRSKSEGEEKLRVERKRPTGAPEPRPHPVNITADPWTNNYRIEEALSAGEKEMEGRFLSARTDAGISIKESFRAFQEASSDEERDRHRKDWVRARSTFIRYNSKVSRRIRVPAEKLDSLFRDPDAPPADEEEWDDEF